MTKKYEKMNKSSLSFRYPVCLSDEEGVITQSNSQKNNVIPPASERQKNKKKSGFPSNTFPSRLPFLWKGLGIGTFPSRLPFLRKGSGIGILF